MIGLVHVADMAVVLPDRNLLADGDMERTTVVGWLGDVQTPSKQPGAVADGERVLRCTSPVGGGGYCYVGGFTSGRTYRVTGWIRSDGAMTPTVRFGAGSVNFTTSASWQRVDLMFTPNSQYLYFYVQDAAAGYVEIDDFRVVEHRGAVRMERKNLLTDGDMEQPGVVQWACAVMSSAKEPGAAVEGERVLRVTSPGTGGGYCYIYVTVGKKYRVTGWARGNGTTTGPLVRLGSQHMWAGTTSTAWQRIDATMEADGIGLYLLHPQFVAGYADFDDLVITEYVAPFSDTNRTKLADGDMEKPDTSSWLSVRSVNTKEVDAKDGRLWLKTTEDAQNSPLAYQTILTVGKKYRVTGWGRGDGTHHFGIGDFTNGTKCVQGTTSTEWQRIDCTMVAASANFTTYSNAVAGTGGWAGFDEIAVYEID